MSPIAKSDIAAVLQYVLESEREDFEEQCAENGISVSDALNNPDRLNHVYGYAFRASEAGY